MILFTENNSTSIINQQCNSIIVQNLFAMTPPSDHDTYYKIILKPGLNKCLQVAEDKLELNVNYQLPV